jgi:uncharacterized membrane protein
VRVTLAVHILAGALGILTGFVALYAAKGARVHRASGMLFVYAMLTMCACGTVLAVARDKAPALNVPAALLTAYLVVTALTTVRPVAVGSRPLAIGGLVLASALAVTDLALGFQALATGTVNGLPAFPFFMFGAIATLASVGDVRVMRTGAPRGTARLARHLWRMCVALFIASLSLFIGQARVFPKAIRIPGLLALPVLVVLVTMLYWLWRVRIRRSRRGIARAGAPEPA